MPFSGILRVTVRLALSFGHWFVIQLHTNRINSSVSVHTYRMEYVRIKWNVQICHFVCTSNYYLNERVRTYCNVIDFVYVEYAERERERAFCACCLIACPMSFRFCSFIFDMCIYLVSVSCMRIAFHVCLQPKGKYVVTDVGASARTNSMENVREIQIIIIDWWHFHSFGWNIVMHRDNCVKWYFFG